MIDTDETLLERMKGLPADAAWGEFYGAYAPPLRRFLAHLGLNAAEVEEALQDTMLALAKQLPKFERDPDRKFRNLVLTIARRAAGKLRRATGRRAKHEARFAREIEALWGDAGSASPRAEGSEPETEADEAEWRWAVVAEAAVRYRAHTGLGEREWGAFEAYALRGRPARAVSAETGVSETALYTLKSRHFRPFKAVVTRLLREIDDA